MAELPSFFRDFLHEINLTKTQVADAQQGHTTLRERLQQDEELSKILVETFLQGSYRRSTAIRPAGDQRSDVDVIVVTNLDREKYTPAEVFQYFVPFMERYYKGQYRFQGRSIGIELSDVDLDVVPTSAPSMVAQEALKSASVRTCETLEDAPDWRLNEFWPPIETREQLSARSLLFKSEQSPEWKLEPLWIPDQKSSRWERTNPLGQLQITRDKNRSTNGWFVRVVKALKWWRRTMRPMPEHPKSYPFERLLRECCPDGITSAADGVTRTLEELVSRYALEVALGRTPDLRDPGVDPNILHRVTAQDFAAFMQVAKEAAELARRAYEEESLVESAKLWRELFGSKFPETDTTDSNKDNSGGGGKGGFSERREQTILPPTRFA